MSTKKIIIVVVIVLVIAGITAGTILHGQAGITKVATGKVVREDLVSTVSGTGQIKPKTYVNVGATSFGRITHLYVKEGDHVHKGDILARVESVQPEATVDAQQANIASSRTDIASYVAAENTAQANITQAKADLEQKKFDFDRAQALYTAQLIAKQDFDAKKAAYDVSAATLDQRVAALAQARAQTASQRAHLDQAVASQRANFDALDKTISRAPFDGLVTNVPVREGETVVVGIQNAEGSTLMTLADMSVITAEVKVDETDIVNMRLGQAADVTVDALPGRTFKGHVAAAHHRNRHLAVHHRHRRGKGLQGRRHSRPAPHRKPRRAPSRPLHHRQNHRRREAQRPHPPHSGPRPARHRSRKGPRRSRRQTLLRR
jgi:HlyD family secretion protein